MKNGLEQHIKQSLENFEADYNPADWTDLNNKLNKTNIGQSTNIGKRMMLAAAVAAVGGAIYFFAFSNTEDKLTPVVNTANLPSTIIEENHLTQYENSTSKKKENEDLKKVVNVAKKNTSVTHTEKNAAEDTPPIEEKQSHIATAVTPAQNQPAEQTSDKPVVTQQPPPAIIPFVASFHFEKSKVCVGESIQFTADNKDVSCIYKWSFGDGKHASEQNPSHVFTEAGIYHVKLHLVSIKEKKHADQKEEITVMPAPIVHWTYAASEENNLLINFDADADKGIEWKWNFGDKQTTLIQNPSHTYSSKGVYTVELTAKNSAGCSGSVSKELNLQSALNLLAPNAFTPDGNGINDTWMPVTLQTGDYVFTLSVYDHAGNIVFTTSDKNHPWDGQNTKVGDTFVWKAVVKDKNGEDSIYKGVILIAE